jgi:trans-2,3-dihydro-3-hydroxyanthranilate isomerase
VFTDVPLEGNPVAVFIDGEGLSEDTMQRAARELNLSETVFLFAGEHGSDARVRIFTPTSELPFAGHPMLGSAFVVGRRDRLATVRLQTRAGIVKVALRRELDEVVYGEMDQPIPVAEPFRQERNLLAALRVARSELPVRAYRNGPLHVYVALGDETAVSALEPDVSALAKLGALGVSCFAGRGTQFKTRMFAPALGVVEDPATGSAAGPLALHLALHGRIAFGAEIEIRQGMEIGRPSVLRARVEGAPERVQRVGVGGSAVFVAGGSYRLD